MTGEEVESSRVASNIAAKIRCKDDLEDINISGTAAKTTPGLRL
jgi:hypothetical protein